MCENPGGHASLADAHALKVRLFAMCKEYEHFETCLKKENIMNRLDLRKSKKSLAKSPSAHLGLFNKVCMAPVAHLRKN